jgi:hypothetical protein
LGPNNPVGPESHARDFFNHDNSKEVTRGKVAWNGDNEFTKRSGRQLIPVCRNTWENPHLTTKVVSNDYMRVGETVCAPFCVAVTLEEK